MINATGQTISSVVCDGKWQLVGPSVHSDVKGNPAVLPAWRVTLVSTYKFDGYCKNGLVAQTNDGTVYQGALVSADGTFSAATFITFMTPRQ